MAGTRYRTCSAAPAGYECRSSCVPRIAAQAERIHPRSRAVAHRRPDRARSPSSTPARARSSARCRRCRPLTSTPSWPPPVAPSRRMAAMPAHERAALLLRVADLIEAEQDSLARCWPPRTASRCGRPAARSAAAIRIFRGYAGEATRLFGRQIPLDAVPGLERHLAVTMREPLGVGGRAGAVQLPGRAVRPQGRRRPRRRQRRRRAAAGHVPARRSVRVGELVRRPVRPPTPTNW